MLASSLHELFCLLPSELSFGKLTPFWHNNRTPIVSLIPSDFWVNQTLDQSYNDDNFGKRALVSFTIGYSDIYIGFVLHDPMVKNKLILIFQDTNV